MGDEKLKEQSRACRTQRRRHRHQPHEHIVIDAVEELLRIGAEVAAGMEGAAFTFEQLTVALRAQACRSHRLLPASLELFLPQQEEIAAR